MLLIVLLANGRVIVIMGGGCLVWIILIVLCFVLVEYCPIFYLRSIL